MRPFAGARFHCKQLGYSQREAERMAGDYIPRPSELTFLATDTRTPYVAAFDGADANKVAHYMLRWESTRGETDSLASPLRRSRSNRLG